MKKIILLAFIGVLGNIVLESKIAKRDGTDPGYTGSPGDSSKNCTTCHGGITLNEEGWITSNIPAEGYTPGETYTIKATNYAMGGTRFGFEISPQALNGDLLGTMVITDTARTKLVGDDKYITYKADGVEGVDSNVWIFDWIAPASGTGDVVFYGAFNSNPGHKGGDNTTLSTLTVHESGATGISNVTGKIANVLVFPNPSNDDLKLSFDVKTASDVTIDITDIQGKHVMSILNGKQVGNVNKSINTQVLQAGTYLIRIKLDGKVSTTRKLSVVH
jgi:hypothetical protein